MTTKNTKKKQLPIDLSKKCKFGCNRGCFPGRTLKGNPFDTCCRSCAVSKGGNIHDKHCNDRNMNIVKPTTSIKTDYSLIDHYTPIQQQNDHNNNGGNVNKSLNNDDQKSSVSTELAVIQRELKLLSLNNLNEIKIHYAIVNTQLSSLFFNTQIVKHKSATTLEVQFKHLPIVAPKRIASELKTLNVIKSVQDSIIESIMNKVEILQYTKDNSTIDLTQKFYYELNSSFGGISYVGLIIFGFAPTTQKNKIKLISCGHCEEWKVSKLKKLKKKNIKPNHIQNYILAQMLDQLGIQDTNHKGLNYVGMNKASPTTHSFTNNTKPSSALQTCLIQ